MQDDTGEGGETIGWLWIENRSEGVHEGGGHIKRMDEDWIAQWIRKTFGRN